MRKGNTVAHQICPQPLCFGNQEIETWDWNWIVKLDNWREASTHSLCNQLLSAKWKAHFIELINIGVLTCLDQLLKRYYEEQAVKLVKVTALCFIFLVFWHSLTFKSRFTHFSLKRRAAQSFQYKNISERSLIMQSPLAWIQRERAGYI